MLRITRLQESGKPLLRLEGGLEGPWVELLRRECEGVGAGAEGFALDLSGLTHLDRSGALLLARLRETRDCEVRCCNLISDLIDDPGETP